MKKINVKDLAKWKTSKNNLNEKYFDRVLFNLYAVAETKKDSDTQFLELTKSKGLKYRRIILGSYHLIYITHY